MRFVMRIFLKPSAAALRLAGRWRDRRPLCYVPAPMQRIGDERLGCAPVRGEAAAASLGDIVARYIRDQRPKRQRELRFYRIQRSLEDAIEVAALAKLPDGKRHPHQRRIPKSTLEASRKFLLRADVRSCRTFASLIRLVEKTIGHLHMAGPLLIYDTAVRIGAYLRLDPEVVYLHAGTKQGAKALGLDHAKDFLHPGELPRAFAQLSPCEIEDCLCIYKRAMRTPT